MLIFGDYLFFDEYCRFLLFSEDFPLKLIFLLKNGFSNTDTMPNEQINEMMGH